MSKSQVLDTPVESSLRVAEVVAALSQALDLGSGSTQWHSVRTCILGMRIAAELKMTEGERSDLYFALLLKDAGCSSNASKVFHSLASDDIAAKRALKTTDWTRVGWETLQYALTHIAPGKPFVERVRAILKMASKQKMHTRDVTAMRCERGASMARYMGLAEMTAEAIRGLDEHWDGKGNPEGLRGEQIPVASRIMLLAQTLEVFYMESGGDAALETVRNRSGKWFDPKIVAAALSLAKRGLLWTGLALDDPLPLALRLEPGRRLISNDDVTLDAVCQAFAQIVDAKSPFTYNHSHGVANAAVAISGGLGLAPARPFDPACRAIARFG